MANQLTPQQRADIQEVYNRLGKFTRRIYLFNVIPPNKLNNARRAYAQMPSPTEETILLHDSTAFGSARNGFLLTSEHFYSRFTGYDPVRIQLSAIESIGYRAGSFGKNVIMNSRGKAFDTFVQGKDTASSRKIAQTLIGVIEVLQPHLAGAPKNPVPPSVNPQELHQKPVFARCIGCGATGKVGQKCKFCRKVIPTPQ